LENLGVFRIGAQPKGGNGATDCGAVRRQQDQHEQAYVYMVLLTSKESKEDIVTGLESGADDYLTKPFNADELKARLRTGERILLLGPVGGGA
jgi:DNA-binding response OmpR family regulator